MKRKRCEQLAAESTDAVFDADVEEEDADSDAVGAQRKGLSGVVYFVLDEADRMLDMGFRPQVQEIVSLMGLQCAKRQTLMFSATWPPGVRAFSEQFLEKPLRLFVEQGDHSEGLLANQSVTQLVEVIRESEKEKRLNTLLEAEESRSQDKAKALIFANTKKGCAELASRLLRKGFNCAELHGNLDQATRASALKSFTTGESRHLVATDIAARGLDVDDITLVVCYDFPDSMATGVEDYVHRVGRTGRAGKVGNAVTFFPAPEDVNGTRSAGNAHELVKVLKAAGQNVPSELAALDRGPGAVLSAVAKRKGQKAPRPEEVSTPAAKRPRIQGSVRLEDGSGVVADVASAINAVKRFEDAPFDKRVRQALCSFGFKEPTPVQAYGWPLVLHGRDCVTVAKTGSGKTLGFLVPALDKIRRWLKDRGLNSAKDSAVAKLTGAGPLALVLAPTRELAVQIFEEAQQLVQAVQCPRWKCRVLCCYGGAAWEPQAAGLEAGVELVVATPGRLAFLIGRGNTATAALAKEISELGAAKQLRRANELFLEFISDGGVPTRRLYSTLINAHVLCGDMSGATAMSCQMVNAGFPLQVVEHTTLLKGLLEAGDLQAAENRISAMLSQEPAVKPDLRAVNTLMRGCMKLGETEACRRTYSRLGEWGVTPDAATYKYLVQVLSQSLLSRELKAAMQDLEASSTQSAGAIDGLDNDVALNLNAAQVACLLRLPNACKRALKQAESALSRGSSSQDLFSELRRQEFLREIAELESAVKSIDSLDVVGALSRTFAFPADRNWASNRTGEDQRKHTRKAVFARLRRSLGLDECIRRGFATEEDMTSRFCKCFDKKGVLRWRRVFEAESPEEGHSLPTKLEVCSGTGDWVLAQASAESGSANWAACELRYDRVWNILRKMTFARLQNLAILAGDALVILSQHIPASSLSQVCINFPEPPQTVRNASCEEAESHLHLLGADFFRAVHAALSSAGQLTIHSDNEGYMQSLAKTLASLEEAGCPLFVPHPELQPEHLCDTEDEGGLPLCQGTPGPEFGHAASASSQFDRFFAHGNHSSRYFLAAVKST